MSDLEDLAAPPAPKPAPATIAQTETAPGMAPPDAAPQGQDDSRSSEQASFEEIFPPRARDEDKSFEELFPTRPKPPTAHVPLGAVLGNPALSVDVPLTLDPAQWKDYMNTSRIGRALSLYGEAFTGPGMGDEAIEFLTKAGVINGKENPAQQATDSFGQVVLRPLGQSLRTINGAVLRPLVGGLDVLFRAIHGAQEVIADQGGPGRDIAAMIDMEMTFGGVIPGGSLLGPKEPILPGPNRWERLHDMTKGPAPEPPVPVSAKTAATAEQWGRRRLAAIDAKAEGRPGLKVSGPEGEAAKPPVLEDFLTETEKLERQFLRSDPHGEQILEVYKDWRQEIENPQPPMHLQEQRANGVIGEPESNYMGTTAPTEQQAAQRRAAAAQVPPETFRVRTVDDIAREGNQDLFREYDDLRARREKLASWMRELQDKTVETIEANPPAALRDLDAQIEALERKAANAGNRRRAEFLDEADDLYGQREDLLADLVRRHPDMVTVRNDYLNTDYRMRDLSPAVSRAIREAGDQMPGEVPSEPVKAPAAPEIPPPVRETPEVAAEPPPEAPAAAPAAPALDMAKLPGVVTSPEQVAFIAQDVATKLRAVGRPVEEADAVGRLVAERYSARAQQWEGRRGSAREMYEADIPEFRVGQRRAKAAPKSRVRELAQRVRDLFRRDGDPTETPEFKAWFGDSVLVKEDGSPLVLYHGTADDIHEFDLDHPNRKDSGWLGRGVYLTDDPGLASTYSSLKAWDVTRPSNADRNVLPVYASVKNPYWSTLADKQRLQAEGREAAEAWTRDLQAQGYDGVILEYGPTGGRPQGSREVVVFDRGDVKSVFNRGTFDRNDPRILFQGADPPPFLSALERAIEGHKVQQAPAKDWGHIIDKLPGVTKNEIEWTGVKDWLEAMDGQVTRAQVLEFIKQNGVQVVEVEKGAAWPRRPSAAPSTDPVQAPEIQAKIVDLQNAGYELSEHPEDPRRIGFIDNSHEDSGDLLMPEDMPAHLQRLARDVEYAYEQRPEPPETFETRDERLTQDLFDEGFAVEPNPDVEGGLNFRNTDTDEIVAVENIPAGDARDFANDLIELHYNRAHNLPGPHQNETVPQGMTFAQARNTLELEGEILNEAGLIPGPVPDTNDVHFLRVSDGHIFDLTDITHDPTLPPAVREAAFAFHQIMNPGGVQPLTIAEALQRYPSARDALRQAEIVPQMDQAAGEVRFVVAYRPDRAPLTVDEVMSQYPETVGHAASAINQAVFPPVPMTPAAALPSTPTKFGQYQLPGGTNYREILLTLPRQMSNPEILGLDSKWGDAKRAAADAMSKLQDLIDLHGRNSPEALAQEKVWKEQTRLRDDVGTRLKQARAAMRESFTESHWPEPDVLAHFRVNDRVGPNGERILHIEEIQSDWHQKGKKRGYKEDKAVPVPSTEAMMHEMDWASVSDDGLVTDLGGRTLKYATKAEALADLKRFFLSNFSGGAEETGRWIVYHNPPVVHKLRPVVHEGRSWPNETFDTLAEAQAASARRGNQNIVTEGPQAISYAFSTKAEAEQWAETIRTGLGAKGHTAKIVPEIRQLSTFTNAVPNAPFKESKEWAALALKRAVRYAAEHGYDRITWTTGEQQVDRYRQALRKAVDEVHWTKTDKGIHLKGYKRGEKVVDTIEKENALSDAIGKSMGDKIIADEGQTGVLKGDDITVSDTGMAGFYDRILREIASKLYKKYGVKVGEASLDSGKPKEAPVFEPMTGDDRLGFSGLEDFADGSSPRSVEMTLDVDGKPQPALLMLDPNGLTIMLDDVEVLIPGDVFAYAKDLKSADRAYDSLSTMWPNPEMWDAARPISGGPQLKIRPAGGTKGYTVHSFDVTPDLADHAMEGQPLWQSMNREPPKGSYTLAIPGNRAIIKIFENADASTAVHELQHHFTEELLADAARADAPEQLKRDAETLRAYAKSPGTGPLKTAGHERIARGFERYLMEGRAPSKALAEVFERFRQWLLSIYRTVANLRSPITPEIREVFDRLLAHPVERPVVDSGLFDDAVANRHEVLVKTTHGSRGERAADDHHFETAEQAQAYASDLVKELRLRRPEAPGEAGGRAPQRPGDPGGGAASGDLGGAAPDAAQPRGGVSGRDQASPQGFGPPRPVRLGPPRKQGLYARVPARPPSLGDFLKARGGIQDHNGEVSALGVKKPGLIKASGEKIDDAALAAWENGFFPEWSERPTVREFLDKLGEDLRGTSQWSEFDADAVAAYEAARGRNAEIDRLAHDLEIETKDLSYEDFWDKVAERKSAEEQARILESQASAAEDAFEEAERLREEALADMPAEWQPEAETESVPRTQEDLDNAYRSETAARGARPSKPDVRGPDAPAGGPAGLQAGDRSLRGVAGDAGRERPPEAAPGPGEGRGIGAEPPADGRRAADSDAPERVPSAVDRFEELDPQVVDKAGNIRLDNLNSTEDVNRVLREYAESNGMFMDARRGVVTDAEVLAFADAMGVEASDLNIDHLRKISLEDGIPLAARIQRGRQMLIDSAKKVHEAMAGEDELAYLEASQRHLRIQETLSAITAEWGRAGRAFRKSADEASKAQDLSQFLVENTGRTLFQVQMEMKLGRKLSTPQAVSRTIQQWRKPSNWDKVIEVWINGLLSLPATHNANITANAMMSVSTVAETGIAAGIGQVRHMVSGTQDRVFFGEALEQLFGIREGTREGLRVAATILKDGDLVNSLGLLEQARPGAIEGTVGEIARLPGRLLGAEDAIFKAVAYRQKINQLAYRTARKEGLEGQAMANRIASLRSTPTADMMKEATDFARYQTFQKPLGEIGKALQRAMATHPGFKFIVPFMRTPTNIAKYTLERSPLALASLLPIRLGEEVAANLRGENGAIARDTQLARIAFGSSIAILGYTMAAGGDLVGAAPENYQQAQARQREGVVPYGIKAFGDWWSVNRLGPIGFIMGMAADAWQIRHPATQAEADRWGSAMMGAFLTSLTNLASLRGPAEFFKFLDDPGQEIGRYTSGFAGSFVPSLVAGVTKAADPFERETREWWQRVAARVPFGRGLSKPRVDLWGRDIRNIGYGGKEVVSPSRISPAVDDPVEHELRRLEYFPALPADKILGVKLTDQQLYEYRRVAGRLARQKVEALLQAPGWGDLLPDRQRAMLRDAFMHPTRGAHAQAQSYMKFKYQSPDPRNPRPDDIAAQAVLQQRALTQGFRDRVKAALR